MINRLRMAAAALHGCETTELAPLDLNDAGEAGLLLAAILNKLEALADGVAGDLDALVPHHASGDRAFAARLRCSARAAHDASWRLYWAGVDISRYRDLLPDVRQAPAPASLGP